jgi:hypothetical protein
MFQIVKFYLLLELSLLIFPFQTPKNKEELYQNFKYIAEHVARKTTREPGVVFALICQETGGKSKALKKGFNFGGLSRNGKPMYFNNRTEGLNTFIKTLANNRYNVKGRTGAEYLRNFIKVYNSACKDPSPYLFFYNYYNKRKLAEN